MVNGGPQEAHVGIYSNCHKASSKSVSETRSFQIWTSPTTAEYGGRWDAYSSNIKRDKKGEGAHRVTETGQKQLEP